MKKIKLFFIILISVLAFYAILLSIMFIMSYGKTETAVSYSVTEITAEEPPTETTTQAPPTKISLIMAGDILAHEGVYNSGLQSDGTYNFDHLFAHVKSDIQSADMAIVNQEVILGGTEMGLSAYPLFNSPQELGDSLVNAGFNIILHATNHTLDKGEQGVENTINFWETNHPDTAYLGIHNSREDYDSNSVYFYTKNDITVSVLNYTYGTNGIPLPQDKPYIINLLNEDKVKADMAYAKENSDFMVVCPHWGTEYRLEPDESQLKWAQFFADNGADLVIGTHPHVIEPVTTLTGINGNKTLVFYSLGNFVSNQDTVNTMLGAMAKVTISNSGGKAHIEKYSAEPVVTHLLFGRGLITTYKLSDYTEELASENKISLYDSGFSLNALKELSRSVLGTP